MQNPGTNPYSTRTASGSPNALNLSDTQRMIAWVVLGAGVIALVWGLMRTPDTTNASNTPPRSHQRDATSGINTP